jgi:hypothetical protein
LPASATSYADTSPLSDPSYCYMLFPVQGTPASPVGSSDLLCSVTGFGTGAPPGAFSLQLTGQSARLTWSPPPFALGSSYTVLALSGDGVRAVPVPSGTYSLLDDTEGMMTCYAVYAVLDGTAVGNTDILCGWPGLAQL